MYFANLTAIKLFCHHHTLEVDLDYGGHTTKRYLFKNRRSYLQSHLGRTNIVLGNIRRARLHFDKVQILILDGKVSLDSSGISDDLKQSPHAYMIVSNEIIYLLTEENY